MTLSFLFTFCQEEKSYRPQNSETFYYVDKRTNDSSIFYGYRDLDTAIHYAKAEKKNILLIFGGWAHLADGNLQWKTLASYGDKHKIQENFILAWLPVDDKRILNDTSKIVYWHGKERRLRTIGNRYAYFQNEIFNSSIQPFHCFIDTLGQPYGQTLYAEWDNVKVSEFINSGLTK